MYFECPHCGCTECYEDTDDYTGDYILVCTECGFEVYVV